MSNSTNMMKLRDLEAQVSRDISALRRAIIAARKGENSRIKNTTKYIARVGKQIAKEQVKQAQLQEKEIAKIERFLGDSFETLKEAREELDKQTRKATEKERLSYLHSEKLKAERSAAASKTEKQRERKTREAERIGREITGQKLNPRIVKYKIRQLSELERQSVIDFLTDKKTFNDSGLGYLQPGERITVSVPYRYFDPKTHTMKIGHAIGRKVFSSWPQFQGYLISYMTDESTEDWLGEIEIMKYLDDYNYRMARARQSHAINERRKEVRAYTRSRIRELRQANKEKQQKLEASEREVKRLRKQLENNKKG